MRTLLFIFIILFFSGALFYIPGLFGFGKGQKLVLDCNLIEIEQKHFYLHQDFKKRIQFTWYRSEKVLQGNELNYTSVTPFQRENDFEAVFERNINNQGLGDTLRTIVFNKITSELIITHPEEETFPDRKYSCIQK